MLGQCNRSIFSSAKYYANGHMCTVPPSHAHTYTHPYKTFGTQQTHNHTHMHTKIYLIFSNARTRIEFRTDEKQTEKWVANAIQIYYFKINRKCLWDIWRMHVMAIAVSVCRTERRIAIRFCFTIIAHYNPRMVACTTICGLLPPIGIFVGVGWIMNGNESQGILF